MQHWFSKSSGIILALLAISGMFITGWVPENWFEGQAFKHIHQLNHLPLEHSMNIKTLPLYLFSLLAILLYLKGKHIECLIVACCIPFLNVVFLPMIYGGLGIGILMAFVVRKITIKKALYLSVPLFLSFASFTGFYSLFGVTEQPLLSRLTNFISLSTYVADIQYLITTIPKEAIVANGLILLFLLVLLVFNRFALNRKIYGLWVIVAAAWGIGLLFSVLFRFLGPDAYQFLSIPGVTLVNISIWLGITYLLLSNQNRFVYSKVFLPIYVGMFMVIGIGMLTKNQSNQKQYSSLYLEALAYHNAQLNNPIKLVLLKEESYRTSGSNKEPFMTSTICGAGFYMLPGKDHFFSIDVGSP
ncbi:MAG: hypothetical protein JKY54_02145, partial [Flavobacteriales bacterium]|nr:hypothetical protein [Flavobacteriales bacterium]